MVSWHFLDPAKKSYFLPNISATLPQSLLGRTLFFYFSNYPYVDYSKLRQAFDTLDTSDTFDTFRVGGIIQSGSKGTFLNLRESFAMSFLGSLFDNLTRIYPVKGVKIQKG